MKRISFSLTTEQVVRREKTVTRRDPRTWRTLRPGDRLEAIDRAMGLRKGERSRRLAEIEVVSVRVEPLDALTAADCVAEGFPERTPAEFVEMFCRHFGGAGDQPVRRIEFRYLPEAA